MTKKISLWSPQPVQAADAILAISKLMNSKSAVLDQINLQHIKERIMVTDITFIINTSIIIITKVFPQSWKHSIYLQIYKSRDKEEPTNFRPINLLPKLSKIL